MKLLYYNNLSYGGIANYAHHQAKALSDQKVDVVMLCPPLFAKDKIFKYEVCPTLKELHHGSNVNSKILGRLNYAKIILQNIEILTKKIKAEKYTHVLFSSYFEYLSPLWAFKLKKLSRKGVTFGAIVHDPVRDYIVGPNWWHVWSVACGYSFMKELFIHDYDEMDMLTTKVNIRKTTIPHGLYDFGLPLRARNETLNDLNIPHDAKIVLSFGYIRDNKNLDLLIKALVNFPKVYLIVAGREQSSRQHPLEYYREIAKKLGVENRCKWINRYIQESEAANYFNAADIIACIYGKDFHSASGVLNAAVHFRRACIASSGNGALKTVMQKYKLGVWVSPGNEGALNDGLKHALEEKLELNHEEYIKDNTWENSAKIIMSSFATKSNDEKK